jgi:hypothetical protein
LSWETVYDMSLEGFWSAWTKAFGGVEEISHVQYCQNKTGFNSDLASDQHVNYPWYPINYDLYSRTWVHSGCLRNIWFEMLPDKSKWQTILIMSRKLHDSGRLSILQAWELSRRLVHIFWTKGKPLTNYWTKPLLAIFSSRVKKIKVLLKSELEIAIGHNILGRKFSWPYWNYPVALCYMLTVAHRKRNHITPPFQ